MKNDKADIILIVEDDEDDRMVFERSLRRAGYEGRIEFCEDGAQFIKRLRRSGEDMPALVLLDLDMPRMGGLEALSIVRGRENRRTLPIVVVTSSELPTDVSRAYSLGANSYVRKPSRLADLRNVMDSIKRFWLDTARLPTHNPA